ncbi:MAG TPA: M48 family metallopeptidase [Terriglobales bacterium]|nr:M48 family metallopeptidase [Terriglobales bacterium]
MNTLKQSLAQRLVALALIVAMTGCAAKQTGPLQPGQDAYPQAGGFNQYSPEQEVEIGKQVAAQADAQYPVLPPRGPVQDYVSTLGQKLASHLPENPYQFEFKVINQKEINAFALPGGPIRINVGTLQAADSEAQLAGVMAHEIAHVYMRHATRNASKEALISLPAQILGAITGNGAVGQLAQLGIGVGVQGLFLKYSRDAESEADRVGAKLMYESGYDPRAMAQFFEKLEGEGGGSGGPQFLSDHPNPGNRAQSVTEAISQLPAKRYLTAGSDYRAAKAAAAQMKPYTGEQIAQMQRQKAGQQPGGGTMQNPTSDSVMPSGSFQTLNQGAFQIAYPSNWKVFGSQQGGSVTIAPEAGVSGSAVAYGVMINGYTPQQQQSLSQSVSEILRSIQQSNPQVQAASQARQATVNGMPAVIMDLRGPSPLTNNGQPVAERDTFVAVQRQDGSVIWMMFVAPEQHYSALSSTYQRMIESLRVG